jgi:hypothetical protein
MLLTSFTLAAKLKTPRNAAELALHGYEGSLSTSSMSARASVSRLSCTLVIPADYFRSSDGELIFSNPDNSCLIAVIPL